MSDRHRTSTSTELNAASIERVAEATRQACIEAAVRAYQDAAISGLCGEGALEAAVSAMRMLDVERIVGQEAPDGAPES